MTVRRTVGRIVRGWVDGVRDDWAVYPAWLVATRVASQILFAIAAVATVAVAVLRAVESASDR